MGNPRSPRMASTPDLGVSMGTATLQWPKHPHGIARYPQIACQGRNFNGERSTRTSRDRKKSAEAARKRSQKSMALRMQPFTGTFPTGMSEEMKGYFRQRIGDNYAMCNYCMQPVWKDRFPSECMDCTPPQNFIQVHAHYMAEMVKEAAKEKKAIADAATAATSSTISTTPTSTIATAINNLFNNHLSPAIAAEPAHWAGLNVANATEAQLKKEMHDHYATLTAAGAKTNWLDRIRKKTDHAEKLDAFMDVLNNP